MERILIIDDDEFILRALRRILQSEGYEVFEAEDGEAGMKLFREKLPDLVITDIIMPNKEGIETIREMIHERPGAKIIAMSGGGKGIQADMYLKICRKLGVKKTLKKPYEREELVSTVKEVLSG